jgi:hypothetical protein
MFKRPVVLTALLAAAVGVPYGVVDGGFVGRARRAWNQLAAPTPRDGSSMVAGASLAGTPAGTTGPMTSQPQPGTTLEECFRFDVTPAWVTGRWKRVSTVLGDAEQLGMRVALVSGTQADDVAGSLTYYFDKHHQLQRITFLGTTGDARRLLLAVVTPYGLKSQPTTGAALYVAGDPHKPTSHVAVRHLPVVSAASPARVEVGIDLKRGDAIGWDERQALEPEPSLLPSSYRRW